MKDDLYRIDFNLGFREPTKINLLFRGQRYGEEVDITSRYESLNKIILLEILSLFFPKNFV
jgi:KUP system potassium uptake protein